MFKHLRPRGRRGYASERPNSRVGSSRAGACSDEGSGVEPSSGKYMLSFVKRLFINPKADGPRSVTDAVLGELRLSDDAEWWEGHIAVGGRTVGFKIGGEGMPDTKLIAHAHDNVRSLPVFEQSVATFLADEAHRVKHLTQYADEIRQLVIEDICLFWPDRPDDGMIYFKGPDKFRGWRCDYVSRKPHGLGFDS